MSRNTCCNSGFSFFFLPFSFDSAVCFLPIQRGAAGEEGQSLCVPLLCCLLSALADRCLLAVPCCAWRPSRGQQRQPQSGTRDLAPFRHTVQCILVLDCLRQYLHTIYRATNITRNNPSFCPPLASPAVRNLETGKRWALHVVSGLGQPLPKTPETKDRKGAHSDGADEQVG